MSKITFRADDDLIKQLEEFDASKSEVMREALREYLGESDGATITREPEPSEETLDDLIAERVDTMIADRLDEHLGTRQPQDVNVNITLDGDSAGVSTASTDASYTPEDESNDAPTDSSHTPANRKTGAEQGENAGESESNTCTKCGETLSPSHVYCPNCGEKSAHRVFCDCGDEIRSDWAFCPSCGRRTPAADVLDQSGNP